MNPTFLTFRDPSTYDDRELATMVSRLLSPRPEAIRLRRPAYDTGPDEYPVWRRAMLEEYNRRFTLPGGSPPIPVERYEP